MQKLITQILYQTFHYIIKSGLLFKYLKSGQTLILLKIDKFAQQRLYFHFIPINFTRQTHKFEAQYTPTTQLATFTLLALHIKEMPRD